MRSSCDVYKQVAERCSSYHKRESGSGMTNSADDSKSCLNCKHFAEEEYCKLDLYDPIVENLK